MPVDSLDVSLTAITHWRALDDVHLPAEGRIAPTFQPQAAELDKILRRPNLDERLTELLQPKHVERDLLVPSIMSETRLTIHDVLKCSAAAASGDNRETLAVAAGLLEVEIVLDQENCAALAALLRG